MTNQNNPNKDEEAAQVASGLSGATPPQPASAPPAKHEENVFYNVMPATKNQSAMVNPLMKVNQNPAGSPFSPSGSKVPYVKYVGIGLGVALLGAVIYFGINFFASPKVDDTKIKPAGNDRPSVDQQKVTWLNDYFGSEVCTDQAKCGDDADPDLDGLKNADEYKLNTDPNNRDGDGDGLSDGDEVHVFNSNPTNAYTARDLQYNDADFIKGGYDLNNPAQKLTQEQIVQLSEKIKQQGLHQPTLKTLEKALTEIYYFSTASTTPPTISTSTPSQSGTFDDSVEARQDRDAQRSNTTRTIAITLAKYYDDRKVFPMVTTMQELDTELKSYRRVAVNFVDPINKDPFVYSYKPENNGQDFTLTFYSETQKQLIKFHADSANKFKAEDLAAQYDDKRKSDLDTLRTALLLYSANNIDEQSQTYIFPAKDRFKTSIVPQYISTIPKDPESNTDYEYGVSAARDSFTLKAKLSKPSAGKTGWVCNQDECLEY